MWPERQPNADASSSKSDFGEESFRKLIPIARFLSIADAGYFAHELQLLRNIPVTLQAEDDFDAVSGQRSTSFLLCVSKKWAEPATVSLENLVRQSDGEMTRPEPVAAFDVERLPHMASTPFSPFAQDDVFSDRNSIHWVPIVLTLAASSFAVWGIKKLREPVRPQPAAPARAPHDVLREMMVIPRQSTRVPHDRLGRRIRALEIIATGNEALRPEEPGEEEAFEQTWPLAKR